MVKTTTLSTFQAAMQAEREADEPVQTANPLADLAERMVRERGDAVPEVGDPFDGMELEIEPGAAFGLIQGQIRQWVEDRGRWATEEEIRHKANELHEAANADRADPAEATYTVSPDGTVSDFKRRPAEPKAPESQEPLTEMPSAQLYAPGDGEFDDGADYLVSGRLAQRAKVLISRHPEFFNHLHRLSVIYLWRREGGKSKGRVVFGKCSKASGLVKHFSESQFVIWLAADHCRMARYGDREIEALLFHEMLHTAVAEVNENTGRGGGPTLVPHDLEVFRAEIEVYGLWAADLRDVAPAFQQASMFDSAGQEHDASGLDCDVCGGFIDPESGRTVCLNCKPRQPVDDGAGVICHPDGTPMTAEEIADLEAADYRDDEAPEDDDGVDEDGVSFGLSANSGIPED